MTKSNASSVDQAFVLTNTAEAPSVIGEERETSGTPDAIFVADSEPPMSSAICVMFSVQGVLQGGEKYCWATRRPLQVVQNAVPLRTRGGALTPGL